MTLPATRLAPTLQYLQEGVEEAINASVVVLGEQLLTTAAAPAATAAAAAAAHAGPPMIVFLLSVLIIIVGVAGNLFVVTVIFTDRKLLHSSVNMFLLNLALADGGNLLFCLPDVVMFSLGFSWVLPSMLCPPLRFFQEYFLYASVLLQMSIGIERFMAICTPLQMQRFSRRTTVFFLLIDWLVATLFALPKAIYSRAELIKGMTYCNYRPPAQLQSIAETFNFCIVYCIPLVLLTVLYAIMCRRLWGKESMIAGESQQVAILRLRRSVVKMLVISMLIYFVCYTPIQSMAFFKVVIRNQHLRYLFNILVLTSSAANPIVYILCCRHFHQRFVSMMNNIIHCCPRSPEKYQTVITDVDKYARMSVVTHSSSSRRHRKVKQRSHGEADLTLSLRLLPKINASSEADTHSDAAVVRRPAAAAAAAARPEAAVAAAAAAAAAGNDSSPSSRPSSTQGSVKSLRYAGPRASTASSASFVWGRESDKQRYRGTKTASPSPKQTVITVD